MANQPREGASKPGNALGADEPLCPYGDSLLKVVRSEDVGLPWGVSQGCSFCCHRGCAACLKINSRWKPEESRKPQLLEAPTLMLSEEEMSDPIRLLTRVRQVAEPYGMVRVCPPKSWGGGEPLMRRKRLMQELGSLAMPTRIQEISRLQVRHLENEVEDWRKKHTKPSTAAETPKGRSNGLDTEPAETSNKGIKASLGETACVLPLPEYGFEPGFPHSLRGYQGYAKKFAAQYFASETQWKGTTGKVSGDMKTAASGQGKGGEGRVPIATAKNGLAMGRAHGRVPAPASNGLASGGVPGRVPAPARAVNGLTTGNGTLRSGVSSECQTGGTSQVAVSSKDPSREGAGCVPASSPFPSVEEVEGEYWRVVESPSERVEVLYIADVDIRCIPSRASETNSSSRELGSGYGEAVASQHADIRGLQEGSQPKQGASGFIQELDGRPGSGQNGASGCSLMSASSQDRGQCGQNGALVEHPGRNGSDLPTLNRETKPGWNGVEIGLHVSEVKPQAGGTMEAVARSMDRALGIMAEGGGGGGGGAGGGEGGEKGEAYGEGSFVATPEEQGGLLSESRIGQSAHQQGVPAQKRKRYASVGPEGTGEDGHSVSGVMVPWLYFGMTFSSFCWHVEDLHLYSVNRLHWGAPKLWYSVPGPAAHQLEASMRQHLPHLFQEHPDLMHKLCTQLSPRVLQQDGVPIFRVVQRPGDFIITLPRGYHCGFSTGFNCSEAVNVAPFDWLPHGLAAIEGYRYLRRRSPMSFDRLLIFSAQSLVYRGDALSAGKKRDRGSLQPVATALRARLVLEHHRRLSLAHAFLPLHSLRFVRVGQFKNREPGECSFCECDLYLSYATVQPKNRRRGFESTSIQEEDVERALHCAEAEAKEEEDGFESTLNGKASSMKAGTRRACLECAPLLLPLKHLTMWDLTVHFCLSIAELMVLLGSLSD